jgi:hypothetical protein
MWQLTRSHAMFFLEWILDRICLRPVNKRFSFQSTDWHNKGESKTHMYQDDLALLTSENTSCTPTETKQGLMPPTTMMRAPHHLPEIIHLPERVKRQEKRKQGNGQDVDCERSRFST